MSENLLELFGNLPIYLGGHMLLSVATVVAALAISLPLGIVASRVPRLAECALALAGVMQTVPSLALLALMMVLLGGKTGFWPAFLTLILYSVLPILANTVIGIRGVDAALIEAAKGLGMNDRQRLWQVELPLASPVILGGVRTATVMVVGTATLATEIGGVSLGNYIFAGIATLNHTSTIFGCVASALLALGLDQLVRLLEIAARRRSLRLALVAAAALLLVTIAGLYEPVTRWLTGENRVVIASVAFTEQYTLSHVLAQRLETHGFRTERREGTGYAIQYAALQSGDVDCIVAYTGDIWSLLMKKNHVETSEKTQEEVKRFLEMEFGVVYLGPLGFENAYALATTQKPGVTSITDLARLSQRKLARPLTIAGDPGVFHRKEWQNLKEKYPFKNVKPVEMDQALTYAAVEKGGVDAILAYSSDGRIKAYDLKLLTDPEQAFPPYDAILLISHGAAQRPGLVEALQPLVKSISLTTMQEANLRVDVKEQTPKQVAKWLLTTIQP